MTNIISSLIIAVIASVAAIIIFQGLQYAYFSDVLKDASLGNYTTKFLTIQIHNVTYERVSLTVNEERCPDLKEGDICKSGCYVVTIFDIKNNVVDIDIIDDIVCEIRTRAFSLGQLSIEYGKGGKEKVENVTSEWIK